MEDQKKEVLSDIVEKVRLDDKEWLSRLSNPYEVEFADFVRKKLDSLKRFHSSKSFYWHGFPVVTHNYPPVGSDMEKHYLINQFLRKNDPLLQSTIIVALSYSCKSNCRQCYISEYVDYTKKELSVQEFGKVFQKIVDDLGVWHIDLTGGEPLEHPNFFEIVSQIPERKATAILATNSTRTEQRAI